MIRALRVERSKRAQSSGPIADNPQGQNRSQVLFVSLYSRQDTNNL
jgi:hypothetical protein